MGRRGACTTKYAFPTHAAALHIYYRMVERGASPEALHIYLCKKGRCRRWHIGHPITKNRKGKR